MENIIFFGEESSTSQEDLPWLKDWVKTHTDVQTAKEVLSIFSGDKGLLCQTGEYKTFIFRKESTYGYLVEALDTWVKNKSETQPLIISSTTKGKALYGLHQDKPKIIWTFDENKYSSYRLDGKVTPIPTKSNPFLPSDNPVQTEILTPPQSEARAKKTRPEAPTKPVEANRPY